MPAYQLNIGFDPSDLPTIYGANERVIIVKQVNPSSAPVAWVALDPFTNNTIQWEENYAIYASSTSVQNGANISKLAEVAAAPEVWYPFADGTFSDPLETPPVPTNTYALINQYPKSITPALTFGLTQDVTVNGTAFVQNPINAQSVPAMHKAQFTPYETISVFLDYSANSGMVMTEVFSTPIDLTFGGDITELSIQYDGASGQFMQV